MSKYLYECMRKTCIHAYSHNAYTQQTKSHNERTRNQYCDLRCASYLEYVLEKERDVSAVIAEPIRCTPFIPRFCCNVCVSVYVHAFAFPCVCICMWICICVR